MANCKETMERLYEYLDRELDSSERREVETHLALCPPCRDHFRLEYNVLSVVRLKCREATASEDLKSRVKSLCTEQRPSS